MRSAIAPERYSRVIDAFPRRLSLARKPLTPSSGPFVLLDRNARPELVRVVQSTYGWQTDSMTFPQAVSREKDHYVIAVMSSEGGTLANAFHHNVQGHPSSMGATLGGYRFAQIAQRWNSQGLMKFWLGWPDVSVAGTGIHLSGNGWGVTYESCVAAEVVIRNLRTRHASKVAQGYYSGVGGDFTAAAIPNPRSHVGGFHIYACAQNTGGAGMTAEPSERGWATTFHSPICRVAIGTEFPGKYPRPTKRFTSSDSARSFYTLAARVA